MKKKTIGILFLVAVVVIAIVLVTNKPNRRAVKTNNTGGGTNTLYDDLLATDGRGHYATDGRG